MLQDPQTLTHGAAQQIGKYLILCALPESSENELYEAYDPALDRRVLIERLRSETAWQDALALARLDHPFILRVLDVSAPPPAGSGYVIFTLPGGGTLQDRLRDERAQQGARLSWMWQLGEAITAAHAQGFVHRGLDTRSVRLGDDGQVQVHGFTHAPTEGLRAKGQGKDRQDFLLLLETVLKSPRWLRHIQRTMQSDARRLDRIVTQLKLRALRPRGGKWLIAVMIIALLAGSLPFVFRLRATGSCLPLKHDAEVVWNKGRSGAVYQALLRTGKPYSADAARRVGELVDAYLSRITSLQAAVCSPPGRSKQASESERDLRISCLQGQLRKLDSTLHVLEDADDQTAQRAVSLIDTRIGSGELDACVSLTQEQGPAPPAPQRRLEVTRAREAIGLGEALAHAGKYQAARTQLEQADRIAAATQYPPVQAESALLSGQLAKRLGKFDDSVEWLHRAAALADGCRHDRVAAQAWLNLVFVVGDRKGEQQQATEYTQYAEANLHRCQRCDDLWPNYFEELGNLRYQQGRMGEALRHAQEALERRLRLHAPAVDLMRSYNSLGGVYESLERNQEAAEHFHRAIAIAEKELGTSHPQLAVYLSNLGHTQESLGLLDEARENTERALDISLRALGPDHPSSGRIKNALGGILMESGRYAESRAYLHQAIANFEGNRSIGPRHPLLAHALMNLGTLEQRAKHPAEALSAFLRALHIREASLSEAHLDLAFALLGAARARIEQSDAAAGKALLTRARNIIEQSEEQEAAKQELGAGLAFTEALHQVLVNKERRPGAEARRQAQRARALYQKLGDGFRYELAEIDRFLAVP